MSVDQYRKYVPARQRVSRRVADQRWSNYLDDFHTRNPGITEEVLSRPMHAGQNPYQWLLAPLPTRGAVLDLACGSSPSFHVRVWDDWVGVDRSWAELQRAQERGASPLVSGNATTLPFSAGTFEAVVCSMAIMLLQPLDEVLAEVRRVLRPGGTAAFMLPGSWPLTARDLIFYTRLMVTLRQTHLSYPNDRRLARLSNVFRTGCFEMVSDERVRFAYQFNNGADTRQFIDSLYLPSVSEHRRARASESVQHQVGREIGIPLRRVVVRKPRGR